MQSATEVVDTCLLDVRSTPIDSTGKRRFNFRKHSSTLKEESQRSSTSRAIYVRLHIFILYFHKSFANIFFIEYSSILLREGWKLSLKTYTCGDFTSLTKHPLSRLHFYVTSPPYTTQIAIAASTRSRM